MKFFLVSGSHRPKSQSRKVSDYLINSITKNLPGVQTDLLDLAGNPLPLWDEGLWNGDPKWETLWSPIKKRLQEADAVIVVTPEWGGMATPGVRNFLLLCAGGAISHKPGMIVSVSGSRNGAYPVSELRSNTTKNNQLVWIPEHLIVRDAEKVLNPGEPSSEDDRYLRARTDYALKLLQEYARALRSVRESGVVDSKNYPFGM